MVSVVGRIAVVLLALAACLVGSGGAASAVAPSAVVVEDTAGVLDQNTLLPAVEGIQFYEPHPGGDLHVQRKGRGQPQ